MRQMLENWWEKYRGGLVDGDTPEHDRLADIAADYSAQLLESLAGEQKQLLLDYIHARDELTLADEKEAFVKGVRLAFAFLAEEPKPSIREIEI